MTGALFRGLRYARPFTAVPMRYGSARSFAFAVHRHSQLCLCCSMPCFAVDLHIHATPLLFISNLGYAFAVLCIPSLSVAVHRASMLFHCEANLFAAVLILRPAEHGCSHPCTAIALLIHVEQITAPLCHRCATPFFAFASRGYALLSYSSAVLFGSKLFLCFSVLSYSIAVRFIAWHRAAVPLLIKAFLRFAIPLRFCAFQLHAMPLPILASLFLCRATHGVAFPCHCGAPRGRTMPLLCFSIPCCAALCHAIAMLSSASPCRCNLSHSMPLPCSSDQFSARLRRCIALLRCAAPSRSGSQLSSPRLCHGHASRLVPWPCRCGSVVDFLPHKSSHAGCDPFVQ